MFLLNKINTPLPYFYSSKLYMSSSIRVELYGFTKSDLEELYGTKIIFKKFILFKNCCLEN